MNKNQVHFIIGFCFMIGLLIAGSTFIVGCGSTASAPTTIPATTTTTAPDTTTTTSTSTSTTSTTTTSTTTTTLASGTIAGKVEFATTSDGIRGGVAISLINGTTLVATTSANSSDGTYSFADVTSGTYTLLATKEGWTIATETATMGTSPIEVNFTADPTNWEVIRFGDRTTLTAVSSMTGGAVYALGATDSGSAVILKSTTAPYTSWSTVTPPTTEGLVFAADMTSSGYGLLVMTNRAMYYNSTTEGSSWNLTDIGINNPLTSEAIAGFSSSGSNYNYVTESGSRLTRTDGAASYVDITPGGMLVRGVCTDPTKIYVVGNAGTAKSSAIGSISWSDLGDVGSLTNENLTDIQTHGRYFLITSLAGSIFMSNNLASSFYCDLSGVPYELHGVYIKTDNNLAIYSAYVVGGNGLIMKRK